jgi:hypothetical protein
MADTCMGDCLAFIFGGDGDVIQRYLEHEMLADFLWFQRLDYWLEGHGHRAITYYYYIEGEREAPFPIEIIPDGQFIGIGPSPRGGRHAIVVGDGKMLHDPDSSGAGLVEIEYIIGFERITEDA